MRDIATELYTLAAENGDLEDEDVNAAWTEYMDSRAAGAPFNERALRNLIEKNVRMAYRAGFWQGMQVNHEIDEHRRAGRVPAGRTDISVAK